MNEFTINDLIDDLKTKNENLVTVELELPSLGLLGYPKDVIIEEISTAEEQRFTKQLLVNKITAIIDLLKSKVKFKEVDAVENTRLIEEELSIFDRDFLLVELARLTFAEPVKLKVTDPQGHEQEIIMNYEDLLLNKLEKPEEKVELSNFIVYLGYMRNKHIKILEKFKSKVKDPWNQLLYSLSLIMNKVVYKTNDIETEIIFESHSDAYRLLQAMSPRDIKKITDKSKIMLDDSVGYKLEKEYFCSECLKTYRAKVESLNFFPSI